MVQIYHSDAFHSLASGLESNSVNVWKNNFLFDFFNFSKDEVAPYSDRHYGLSLLAAPELINIIDRAGFLSEEISTKYPGQYSVCL